MVANVGFAGKKEGGSAATTPRTSKFAKKSKTIDPRAAAFNADR